MINVNKQDLLCILHDKSNYAIELSSVVEICFDLPILKIPRLPEYYQGVCNYKGVAVPVVVLKAEESTDRNRKSPNDIILILKTEKYQFGILLDKEPIIHTFQSEEQIEDYSGLNALNLWEEKKIYQKENQIFLLLDLEKTAENLVAYC